MIKTTDNILCFSKSIDDYVLDFIPGNDTLIISFESAGGNFSKKKKNRLGWGKKFFLESSWSLLWIKPNSANWYRGKPLQDTLEELSQSGFFDNYKKVILIGGSMGGYAALAFSSLIKNAIVIALNPQISLSNDLVPWEKRKFLSKGLDQNWHIDSKFVNGAHESKKAKAVYVIYDPFDKNDKKHADSITNANTLHCKIPLVGHNIPTALLQMGYLKKVVLDIVNDDFNMIKFNRHVRKRKELDIYHEKMMIGLFRKGHVKLSIKLYKNAIIENRNIRVGNYPIFKKALLKSGVTISDL